MKKTLLFLVFILVWAANMAQTAPNFNCTDCNGTNYDLYSQLDSGKVIVICWVMPCSTCIPASKTSYNIVQSYQATNPGKVLFFLCDDYGDTPCSSINSWANTNSIPASAYSLRFSNSTINMTNYGSVGMPKIIIVGGADHKIRYSANGTVVASAMQTAINEVLNGNGTDDSQLLDTEVNLYPNPALNMLNLTFTLQKSSDLNIKIFDNVGQVVFEKTSKYTSGVNKTEINTTSFANGNYYIVINDSYKYKTLRFNISH